MAGPAFISEPDRRLDDLRAEVWRVEALGQRLHADAWDKPSRCERWTISDVFAHLAGDFERYLVWLDAARNGVSDPPFARSELAADNEMILERYTGMTGDERLEAFESSAGAYLTAVAEVDPLLPQGNPMGTITVGEQVAWATVECAIHGWDIATAVGIEWPAPASAERLADVWRRRRAEPLLAGDPWEAMLVASGREP
jgi:uncharacterized protein (TIGR03083 family)